MSSGRILSHHLLIISTIILLIGMISCNQKGQSEMDNILIVTGGHDFEPSFYKIFDSYVNVQYDTISQPKFNQMIASGMSDHYSALVFYDMWQEINDVEKKAYISFLEKGQGVVFLHHTLAAYQHWDEYIKIVGGKYIETDFYDITLNIKIATQDHPVTKDISDFSIYDEGYQFVEMMPTIKPLLTTTHPDCTPTVAWTHTYKKSRIVYILLGHGQDAHENPNYRKLIQNAISWVGAKK
jgi:type 1 glutamine amidotransferase